MISLGEYLPQFADFFWIEENGISSNIYLLAGGKVLIDSGNMPGIANEIDSHFPLTGIEAVFITHHHYDHIGGLVELLSYCNPKIIMHRDTLPFMMVHKVPFQRIMEENQRTEQIITLRGAEQFQWDDLTLEVIATPGHTSGDICLYEHRTHSLFSGDMVFPAYQNKNVLADADPATGNIHEMETSFRRLLRYPVNALLPGHGTPILQGAHEHVKNSYLQYLIENEKGDEERAWLKLTEALMELHRVSEALECSEYLLRHNPTLLAAWINKGMALLELRNFDDALSVFEKALKIRPEHPEAILGKGMALIAMERAPEAMALNGFSDYLNQALTRNSDLQGAKK